MRETLRRLEQLEREIEMLKKRVREAIVHARTVVARDTSSATPPRRGPSRRRSTRRSSASS